MKNFNQEAYKKKIVIRAIKDEKFRKELIKNPKEVIEGELKITWPSDISIQVLEQPANKWYIVIPNVRETDLLSETELEQIAGGRATFVIPKAGNICPLDLAVAHLYPLMEEFRSYPSETKEFGFLFKTLTSVDY